MATAGNNVYNQVVDTLGQSQTGMTNAMNYKPMQFNQENMDQFMNPYTSQVITRNRPGAKEISCD